MTRRISGFRSPEDASRYCELYDDLVARWWPVAHEEIDLGSRFGPTRVRRSGPTSGPTSGSPLVLLHPTTGASLGWHRFVAPLCEQHPVYTPDTIGTAGRSVQTEPLQGREDLAAWLDDVLDGLGLDSVHLVGYSEGGWVATVHAALTYRPERIATLTLIEPGGGIERIRPGFLVHMIVRALGTLRAKDKAQAIRRFNRWLNGDVEISDDEIDLILTVFGTFRQAMPRPRKLREEELRRIRAPILLMLGADTKLYDPERVAARARGTWRDVSVEITPGAGHGLAFACPDLVADRILGFVEDHTKQAPRL